MYSYHPIGYWQKEFPLYAHIIKIHLQKNIWKLTPFLHESKRRKFFACKPLIAVAFLPN